MVELAAMCKDNMPPYSAIYTSNVPADGAFPSLLV